MYGFSYLYTGIINSDPFYTISTEIYQYIQNKAVDACILSGKLFQLSCTESLQNKSYNVIIQIYSRLTLQNRYSNITRAHHLNQCNKYLHRIPRIIKSTNLNQCIQKSASLN